MTRAPLPWCALALALSACAAGPRDDLPRGPLTANPSALVAQEIAFARLAREKGQWTAFRKYAADNAELFVPQRVLARDWLKGRADPPVSVAWQPLAAFMACDGSAGATTGAVQYPDGRTGYFNTVWVRQPDGSYRWVIDHGDALPAPLPRLDYIRTGIASCTGRAPAALTAPEVGVDMKVGYARDQSLSWTTKVRADGSVSLVVASWDGQAMVPVITDGQP